jgi:4-amino-4-deoxy-L-arabinose transferase-like glycosyltransferase
MPLVEIHARLANSVVLFVLVVGLWALLNYVRRQDLSSSYWGTLVVGEILLAAQAVVGAVLYVQGGRPPRIVHYLYGVFILLVWPGIFAFTQGRSTRREALIYGLASLFMVGVAIRAIGTGSP